MVTKWKIEEEKYLIENYNKEKKEVLLSNLNKTWSSIQHKAAKLGVKRLNGFNPKYGGDWKLWTGEEIEYLSKNYSTSTMEEIKSNLTGRTLSSITNKAHSLNLENRSLKMSNITKLLEDSPEAYYWIGFLLADGHFYKEKAIQINLSVKDLKHLQMLADFIEWEYKLTSPHLYAYDCKVVPKLTDKFDIKHNKTYIPPSVDILKNIKNNDLLFSLIIGFIDGDGSISKHGSLTIKIYNSWSKLLDYMLFSISNGSYYSVKLTKENLVLGSLSNGVTLRAIKHKAEALKLPLLRRKWDRIDYNKQSKKERSEFYEAKCFKLFDDGFRAKEVIEETKFSPSFVYRIHQKWKSIKAKDIKRELERNN